MKKILVTGSLGYIGSVLTPFLKEEGFDCLGYDTGFFRNCLIYRLKDPKTIIKDIRDFSEKDLEGIDAVIHLAGISNDPFKNFDPKKVYDPTRAYSLKLAKLCKKRGIKFIFASSCSVYGKGRESILDENSETFPQTPYSLNKLQIEGDLKEISDENFSPIILRFATVFGLSPRMRFDLFLNMFVGMALTTKKIVLNSDGKAWRPNVHIKDVCKAIRYCLDLDPREGKPLILNVGDTSENYEIIKVAEMVQKEIPNSEILFLNNNKKIFSEREQLIKDRKIQDGVDTRTYRVSFELIKKTFKGFKCDWSVQKGIKQMINELGKLKLTEKQFKNINFYRLQKFEYLLRNNYLTEDLFWIKNEKNNN
jgi:nucleoside-diphosphate-sugar epimerase